MLFALGMLYLEINLLLNILLELLSIILRCGISSLVLVNCLILRDVRIMCVCTYVLQFAGVWNFRQSIWSQTHGLHFVLHSVNIQKQLTVCALYGGIKIYTKTFIPYLVYIFNPASFTPLVVYKHIIEGGVYGAAYRKRSHDDVDSSIPTWFKQSELFFLSTKQVR